MSKEIIEDLQNIEREQVTVREALTRAVAIDETTKTRMVMPDPLGLEQLMGERRIRLYLGIDPTGEDLHIGHSVPIRKLRQFQDLGHDVILLFGTFTGKIGDPTDRKATRVRLTDEQIARNMATYVEQAGKILDLSPEAKNPINFMKNGDWLSPLTFENVVDLAANFTVQQMMSRFTYKSRLDAGKPISLHEFLYPLMQGYDSVAMDVDLEIGGKDQIPNMIDGATLIKRYKDRQKWVMGTKLIEGPNGEKMGKTTGEIVGLFDPPEVKYEGIMMWPDTVIQMGFEVATSVPMELIHIMGELLEKNQIDAMKLKEALAFRVVKELDGLEAAEYAKEEFQRVKREGQLPRRIQEVPVTKGVKISEILVVSGLVASTEDATLRINQKSIFVDGIQIQKDGLWPETASIISIGKRTIKNIRRVVQM